MPLIRAMVQLKGVYDGLNTNVFNWHHTTLFSCARTVRDTTSDSLFLFFSSSPTIQKVTNITKASRSLCYFDVWNVWTEYSFIELCSSLVLVTTLSPLIIIGSQSNCATITQFRYLSESRFLSRYLVCSWVIWKKNHCNFWSSFTIRTRPSF